MKAKEILDATLTLIRGLPRPYLALAFPTAVMIIGIVAAFKFMAMAVPFVDREIALIVIVGIMGIVTSISTASYMIVSFYYMERATKPNAEK